MTTAIFILQVVMILGFFAAYLIVKNYLPSYMSEKGKNLATKEDITDITLKIEDAKSVYAQQIEHLRSSLTIFVSQRTAFDEQKRQALLQFFDHCVELIFDKLQVNHGDFPMDQGQSLSEYQNSVMNLFTAIFLDYHRVLLYCVSSSDLSSSAERVAKSCIEVRKVFRSHFGTVKMASVEETNAYQSGDKAAYSRAVESTNEAERKYREAIKPHQDSLRAHFTDFLLSLNAHIGAQDTNVSLDLLTESTE